MAPAYICGICQKPLPTGEQKNPLFLGVYPICSICILVKQGRSENALQEISLKGPVGRVRMPEGF